MTATRRCASAAPLRVAHLDTGHEWRGGQAQVLFLMEGLARRGVSSLLLAPRGPLLARARAEGLDALAWAPTSDGDVLALARAARELSRFKPDVAHCHSARAHAVGVPAARLVGVPAVVVARRVAVPVGRSPWSALKYRMPVDRYLCVSRSVREAMRESGVEEARLAVVWSGVGLEAPTGGVDLRRLIGAPPDAPVVVTAAALTPEKRHRDLLEAAVRVLAAVPGAHFAWLGEGECRAALERRRAELGLEPRVHMLGFRDDARALIGQGTVMALASELEGIATSLLDAQALGVPVVATRAGGIPEVVEDGRTGRLVSARDPVALADALAEVLTQPERVAAWVAKARQSVREFHIDRTVDRTLAEYRAVLERRPSAA